MRKGWALLLIIALTVTLCGCRRQKTEEPNAQGQRENDQVKAIEVIPAEDVVFVPEWKELSYDEALAAGGEMTAETEGTYAGSPAIWYTVKINGTEFYFCRLLSPEGEEIGQDAVSYAVVGQEYLLKCGIAVGDTLDKVLGMYPDMAISDFSYSENGGVLEKYSCLDFNPAAYPDGWEKQFDYALMADVDYGEELPVYLALMMKEDKVAALTMFGPTAG